MNTSIESIIDFLNSRAVETPLDEAGLQAFSGELKARIDQLSVAVPGAATDAVTVLYSGLLPDEQHTGIVANNLVIGSQPGSVRTISQTEIGMLLDFENTRFHDALFAALGNNDEDYRKLVEGKDLSGNRITFDSLWDDASRRFVANTTGTVRILSTDGVADSIFAQSELPELFNNPNITEIDGIPRDQYLGLLERKGMEAVRDVIFTNARVQIELTDLAGGNLQDYLELDPGDNFNNYFVRYQEQGTRSRLINFFGELDPERLANLKAVTASLLETGESLVSEGLAKGANRLGMLGAVAGFMLASYTSSVAEESGDHARARDIMAEWAADAAGSAAGEAVGASIGGAAVAIIAAAGVALSAPLTGAIILGAAFIGGIFGAEGAVGIYELTKDKDRDGKIDLFNAMADLLYGDDYTVTDAPLPGFDGARITLDTNFSRGEIVENARASMAWRYALLHLNPFVIEGEDTLYARHNQNSELDIENFSEQYLIDRAEMLLWRLRYEKAGMSYTEEWNAWDVTGDWEFTDQSILLNETDPLQLTIDGWNGLPPTDTPNHKVIFGSSESNTLVGGETSDYLYGGEGGDTLIGNAGDDYLEGGTESDSYVYNTGDGFDIIFDIDGSGRIVLDGAELGGVTRKIGDGLYIDTVDNTYRFSDSGNGTGTLLINNNILIKAFDINAQSFLGITLEGERIDDSIDTGTVINGTPEDDTDGSLVGGDGPDHIRCLAGNDWARGLAGADLMEGGLGNDILEGGQGDDVLHGDSAGSVDQTIDSNGQDVGSSHDWLSGNEGDDKLYGSNGADVLVGGTGDDLVLGGAGDDVIQGDSERKPVDHGWVDAWINNNDLQANGELNPVGAGNDLLLGGAGADQIWGQAGHDVINGGIGNDFISGDLVGLSGQGDRLLSGELHGDDVLNGDKGDDILEGGGGNDMLFGGDDNDRLYGDSESRLIPGGGGLLLRAEYHGRDILFGEAGDDLLVGGGGADDLDGGDGADSLYGDDETNGLNQDSHGDDKLHGGAGNDLLMGNGGDDQLYGESGDDSAWGGAGSDYIAGGPGNDYLVGDSDTNGTDTDGNDTILGGTGDDALYGSGGDDHLEGGAGADALRGGTGNDLLQGGANDDYLNGEEGADTYLFSTGDGMDLVEGDADDRVILPASARIRTSLATGSDGSDYLAIQYGSNDGILLKGGLETAIDQYELNNGQLYNKSDLLNATLTTAIEYRMQAAGEISGGSFGDILVGSSGNDRIFGQGGGDTLAGAGGDDHLLGGDGLDIYRLGWGGGRDRITEQTDSINRLEFLPGVSSDDLNFERQGSDLFIRIRDGRDGVLLEDYYNLNQTWQISTQDSEFLLSHADEPQTVNAAIADTVAAAWQSFGQKIMSAYGGLLRFHGYAEKPDGSFERTYAGGETENRWKNHYKLELSTLPIEGVSGNFRLYLPDMEISVTDFRQEVSVAEQVHLSGSNATYVNAGRSGTNYVSTGGMFNGISVAGDSVLVADYGLNEWRNPLTGELVPEIRGYYLYPSGTTVSGSTLIYRSYTETDYQVKVNIAEITAGSENDKIITGKTHFTLVDGGGGDDIIDASLVDDSVAVPGLGSVSGMNISGALLFGNDGDDKLYGGTFDDLLIGGLGSDSMFGGRGDDTYHLFDPAAGDRIVEWGRERVDSQGDDMLVLPEGVEFDDLIYEWGESVETDDLVKPDRQGLRVEVPVESMHTTLKLSWADSAGVTLVLPHSDKGAGFGIDRVVTATGESRSFSDILLEAGPGPGQDLHDLDNAFSGGGILNGGAGDDWLRAYPNNFNPLSVSGTSVLIGGAGADRLEGDEGMNILIGGRPVVEGADGFPFLVRITGTFWEEPGNIYSGGKGSDELWTTAGSDTILFGLGDGRDSVESIYSVTEADQMTELLNGHDTLRFGSGILPSDISLSDADGDLLFLHRNGEDGLYFREWFYRDVNQLDRVEFENGTVWDEDDILALTAGEQVGDPPVLQTPQSDLNVIERVPFSLVIPESTFVHESEAITYSVEMEDGSVLPEWIEFDSDRLLLSGIADSDRVGDWKIRVIGSTGNGLQASDLFTLSVNRAAGKIVTGGEDDDRLRGTEEGDVIIGGGGSNHLKGGGGDDWFPIIGNQQGVNSFNGGDGTDRIQGSAGDDLIRVSNFKGKNRVEIIDGGEGFDILSGDDSSNRIDLRNTQLIGVERIEGRGGDDTIIGSGHRDNIRGDSGDDLLRGRGGNDRLIGGTGDDWLDGGGGDDRLKGGDGRDALYGGRGDDDLSGGAGKDILYGGPGDDKATGGGGRDTIYGEAGDDYLDGGSGSDHLYAGEGNDTVVFGRNYGHDKVIVGTGAEDELDQFVDRVIFKEGISANQLWFEARDTDLDISIIGTEDRLTIVDWYANSASKADEFVTSDGSMLARESVDRLVSAMAVFNPPAMGETQLPGEMQRELEPVIAAGWQ
ncbi:MAG: hypothetical protein H6963_09160 [Chromatiaceae bacterium]|nr:hypothetical protein [Chromatiaceae bacterium]MCP5444316.1 hypothetical protein [Chromatiaceae bacterium]